jgi:hypothetical protein
MALQLWDTRSDEPPRTLHSYGMNLMAFVYGNAIVATGWSDTVYWYAIRFPALEMQALLAAALPQHAGTAAHQFLLRDGQRDVCKLIFSMLRL